MKFWKKVVEAWSQTHVRRTLTALHNPLSKQPDQLKRLPRPDCPTTRTRHQAYNDKHWWCWWNIWTVQGHNEFISQYSFKNIKVLHTDYAYKSSYQDEWALKFTLYRPFTDNVTFIEIKMNKVFKFWNKTNAQFLCSKCIYKNNRRDNRALTKGSKSTNCLNRSSSSV